ncbi:hypothetical protein SAMN06265347_1334 [Halobellus salinus]|nr:hypothetical protein SAMN06265347_1334 [Halobellus salinus]
MVRVYHFCYLFSPTVGIDESQNSQGLFCWFCIQLGGLLTVKTAAAAAAGLHGIITGNTGFDSLSKLSIRILSEN